VENGALLMTQKERDRLVVLKKAEKRLITQKQAAEELSLSERHVRRLLVKLRHAGDKTVIHGLRGRPSNRKLSPELREKAICAATFSKSCILAIPHGTFTAGGGYHILPNIATQGCWGYV
jgi:biotin operon repressor